MNIKNKHFRNYIITGILSIIPLFATYWIITKLFQFFSSPGSKIIKIIFGERSIPYIPELTGFILTILFLSLIGLFVTNLLGKRILNSFEKLLHKIPIVSIIYKTIKQITVSLGDPQKQSFKKVVLIEYPRKGLWTLTMVTGESVDKDGLEYYHIFVPTTPNPTSGFMLYSLKKDVQETNISVEEGLKIIISGGMLADAVNEIIQNN